MKLLARLYVRCQTKSQKKHELAQRNNLAFYIAVGEYYSKFLADNGFKIEVEEITAEYRKGGADNAIKYVSDRMLSSLVICGSSEECRNH